MEETIAAIATPFGEGGIGIIRISGENAGDVLKNIFQPLNGNFPENRKLTYGHIVDPDNGTIVDEVLCAYMKGPKTYTAEDVVEINCHGGIVSLRKTLELVLNNGARMAEKGEFTKRAFLNGRLDLSQAEAVIDVVKAKADKTYDVAMSQLEGVLSKRIKEIRQKFVDTLVDITVNIDYPDEDIEQMTYEKLDTSLQSIRDDIKSLLDSASTGRIINEGLKVAIIGKPNVGKSSLMNNILKEARAIVTEIPGTTRDTIEESVNVRGIPVILTDTAGIRETDDKIENIGIARSKESFNQADLVIFMLDASDGLDEADMEIMSNLQVSKTIVVLNKTDLKQKISSDKISSELPGVEVIETSMHTQEGLGDIENSIVNRVYNGDVTQSDSLMVTNARHKNLLETAMRSVDDALHLTSAREPLEIIEIDVNSAYENLGEIIGETVKDDILNEVFSRFCLGK